VTEICALLINIVGFLKKKTIVSFSPHSAILGAELNTRWA